jgi:hypothetical protein
VIPLLERDVESSGAEGVVFYSEGERCDHWGRCADELHNVGFGDGGPDVSYPSTAMPTGISRCWQVEAIGTGEYALVPPPA